MNAAGTIRIVAEREIRQRLRGKAFYISTAVIVLAVLAIAIINRVANNDDDIRSVTVGVVGEAPAGFDDTLDASGQVFELSITVDELADDAAARQALADDDADVVVDAGNDQLLFPDEEDTTVGSAVQQAWATSNVREALSDAGLDNERIDDALSPAPLTPDVVDLDGDEPSGVSVLVGTLAGILLFISIQMFGNMILMGVVEEKSTAVIEVLLARVRATQLLTGKVLGIAAIAVLQLVIVIAAGAVALGISGTDIPSAVWAALPWIAVWFLIGFTLYAFLYALAGSLVSRQEDATAAATPVSLVLTTGYMGVFILVGASASVAARVASFFPPFTPLLMPMRIAAGNAPWYEVVLALALLLATVVAVAKVTGRIYNALVLRRGARVRWGDALRTRA
jgi:ABC-2 type transport system permease protein